jgi:hypothetical protein
MDGKPLSLGCRSPRALAERHAAVCGDEAVPPVKASGLLFAYLGGLCNRTRPDKPQVWTLSAARNPRREPWDFLERFAEHDNRATDDVWAEFKLTSQQLACDPLADE